MSEVGWVAAMPGGTPGGWRPGLRGWPPLGSSRWFSMLSELLDFNVGNMDFYEPSNFLCRQLHRIVRNTMEDKQNVSEIISQEPIDHQSVSEVHIDFLY